MRRLFLVPVALSICMSMSGCPKMNNLRQNNSNEVAYDQKVEFQYEVQGGTMQNGYISNGNGIVISTAPNPDAVSPSTPVTPAVPTTPAEPDTPVSNNQLVGTWETIRRSDTYLYRDYIEFYADGTFSQGESEYTHTKYQPELFYDQPEGWRAVPMGFPYWYGTYTVEGNVITLTTLGDSIEESTTPSTDTLIIHSISDSDAIFGDQSGGNRYIKNFKPTDSEKYIEELCALMGVDLSV